MPTLKEIKGRIASVRSTLKITSAMKLVASAKLRKAQRAIEAMRPYAAQLQRLLALAGGEVSAAPALAEASGGPTAIVALASNSSLCGGFNAAVIAKVRAIRQPADTVFSVGRKMGDAMRLDGFPSPEDFSALAEHPSYAAAAALVSSLSEAVSAGRFSRVLVVYNHFVSTSRQTPTVETLLDGASSFPSVAGTSAPEAEAFLFEPSRAELLAALGPKVRNLRLYQALLDSAAAEHAARTVAMQTATDNGENLLRELTLQYNKGRQQKITSEILDLAAGQAVD